MGFGADNTSALAFGGTPGPGSAVDSTESWNGTNWTEVNNLSTARLTGAGCGIITSGLCIAGAPPPGGSALVESWNGTNWTEVNDVNQSRIGLAASGSGGNTSALAFGGEYPPSGNAAITEDWNGVSWAETSDLNTARYYLAGSSSYTQALAFGGTSNSTEEWSSTSNTIKVLTD